LKKYRANPAQAGLKKMNIEWEKMKKQSLKNPELLIKIFVTSIKTAEKKPRLGVVESSVLGVCFFI